MGVEFGIKTSQKNRASSSAVLLFISFKSLVTYLMLLKQMDKIFGATKKRLRATKKRVDNFV